MFTPFRLARRWLDKAIKNGYRRLFMSLKEELEISYNICQDSEIDKSRNEFNTYKMIQSTLDDFDRLSNLEIARRLGYIQCYFDLNHSVHLAELGSPILTEVKF